MDDVSAVYLSAMCIVCAVALAVISLQPRGGVLLIPAAASCGFASAALALAVYALATA